MNETLQFVDSPLFDPEAFAKAFGHDSIEAYQDFYGLKVDGVAGPVTTSEMVLPRCGCLDRISGREAAEASWPNQCKVKSFAYRFDQLNVSATFIQTAVKRALGVLNRMSAAKVNVEGTLQSSDIWATDGPLGGSTLAWSFLPNGNCNDRIEQRYDTSNQNWQTADKLAKVILHEVGHAMGLEHSNDRRDIMFPSIDPSKPLSFYSNASGMPGDRQRMVGFYGAYEPTEPPPPPTGDYITRAEMLDHMIEVAEFRDDVVTKFREGNPDNGGSGGMFDGLPEASR